MLAVMEIPVWAVVIGGALAGVAVLDRILVPSVRWYLRRRFLNAIDRLNARLQLKIQPFKLMRRRDMIDRLTHDPQVMEAVVAYSEAERIPLYMAMQRAEQYAREIVPAFSAFAYFSFATRMAKWLSHLVYDVRLGAYDDAALAGIDPEATVIFVMNHRSNMDYVVVTHLVADRSALSYAVGEWARVWPLQGLIRAMGAYFIRRRGNHGLYRRVLARYVQMATEGGVTQAVFPEGGLTLDGRLRPPKLGLLSYIVAGYRPGQSRDVVFVPVALNYDRVLEDRVLSETAASGRRRFHFRMRRFLRFILHQSRLRMTHRFHRGRASVGFGQPLALSDYAGREGTGDAAVARLGAELMHRIGVVMPVLPVPLVAAILTRADAPLVQEEITARAHELLTRMRAAGAEVQIDHGAEAEAVTAGLKLMGLRHLVTELDGRFSANAKEAAMLAYYANSIAHLMPDAGAPPVGNLSKTGDQKTTET
ncbi:glycerol-3-phosphate acyltransferase [Maritimibacter sp. 55A14]|uniref:1-acyl-sn-glycerol-3-phosphate acyltransferase n=1 Tax=Maritimibacter sp. 55A14 TaxID=2174844 RepID=UPI000D603B9B|nr:1-acyl-sn-glycerol-3-phosphate acyltransferase [Maritimibacter sp. 55A14]PWE28418.1 glycerol-3-phosphate acyltransferase [Maritimibacter sp. 55A14]